MANIWFQAVQDLLFPPLCRICGKRSEGHDQGICSDCLKGVKRIDSPLCLRCGTPFNSGIDHVCGSCLRSPPPYAIARSVALYEYPVTELVHGLKYTFDTTTCEPFLKIARGFNFSPFFDCDIFVPVPLHEKRLKKRGMNQSLVLARILFAQKASHIMPNILVRKKETLSQARLDIADRKKNVRDAFLLERVEIIRNKRICLIDDVFTTGSTAAECARVLMAAGAKEVKVITFARVVLSR